MPTQIPRNGRPESAFAITASRNPSIADSPRAQSANAPCPGNTTRTARATNSGSAEITTSAAIPSRSAASTSPRAADARFPLP